MSEASGCPDDANVRTRLRKLAVGVREEHVAQAKAYLKLNNVECFCAPFEAEWLLASVARDGYVAGVIGEDSDHAPLDIGLMITQLKLSDGSCNYSTPLRGRWRACARRVSLLVLHAVVAVPLSIAQVLPLMVMSK